MIFFADYLEITTAAIVPCGGRKTFDIVLLFNISGPLGLLASDIRQQNTALAGARGYERCCIFQYLS